MSYFEDLVKDMKEDLAKYHQQAYKAHSQGLKWKNMMALVIQIIMRRGKELKWKMLVLMMFTEDDELKGSRDIEKLGSDEINAENVVFVGMVICPALLGVGDP
ncbi:hypothetical protein L6452_18662 [Arctium lappa]|uniref:Uncharacterized protein n=1 Tax=Arctium lappa TaxID=4217 RepID=A0ACB9C6Y5_ARCLA|nr:hypothetical protein L6452_18662 [Arctium lappa]